MGARIEWQNVNKTRVPVLRCVRNDRAMCHTNVISWNSDGIYRRISIGQSCIKMRVVSRSTVRSLFRFESISNVTLKHYSVEYGWFCHSLYYSELNQRDELFLVSNVLDPLLLLELIFLLSKPTTRIVRPTLCIVRGRKLGITGMQMLRINYLMIAGLKWDLKISTLQRIERDGWFSLIGSSLCN